MRSSHFFSRRSLKSYTSQNMLMLHKPKCGEDDICSIGTLSESHIYQKNHFHKNPLYFRIYADSEADFVIDNYSLGNKTTNIYTQNPVLNGYKTISELDDVLKSGYYKSLLGYIYVGWFVSEITKLENKMGFYFKLSKKDIFMTEEDEEDLKNNVVCRFCEKTLFLIK